MSNDQVSVTVEYTPNPNTLKFAVNRTLLERGAANFTDVSKAEKAPLAKKLFGVPGVAAVMIGPNFVTVTKSPDSSWDALAEGVPKMLEIHLRAGEPIFSPDFSTLPPEQTSGPNAEIERKIREVLDNEIRPAVAMDGGDITFGKYEDGLVYLHLQGSCSSCPSSIATLKMGVETRLKAVVPEIKEVVQI